MLHSADALHRASYLLFNLTILVVMLGAFFAGIYWCLCREVDAMALSKIRYTRRRYTSLQRRHAKLREDHRSLVGLLKRRQQNADLKALLERATMVANPTWSEEEIRVVLRSCVPGSMEDCMGRFLAMKAKQ